jgi:hypothetical protein
MANITKRMLPIDIDIGALTNDTFIPGKYMFVTPRALAKSADAWIPGTKGTVTSVYTLEAGRRGVAIALEDQLIDGVQMRTGAQITIPYYPVLPEYAKHYTRVPCVYSEALYPVMASEQMETPYKVVLRIPYADGTADRFIASDLSPRTISNVISHAIYLISHLFIGGVDGADIKAEWRELLEELPKDWLYGEDPPRIFALEDPQTLLTIVPDEYRSMFGVCHGHILEAFAKFSKKIKEKYPEVICPDAVSRVHAMALVNEVYMFPQTKEHQSVANFGIRAKLLDVLPADKMVRTIGSYGLAPKVRDSYIVSADESCIAELYEITLNGVSKEKVRTNIQETRKWKLLE